MANRNTAAELRKVIFLNPTVDADFYLNGANLIVTEKLSNAGMSSDRLKLLELYLGAHFAAISEEKGGLTRTSMGQSNDWFSDVYTAGFGSTRFGQQAMSFDESGILAQMGAGKGKATFRNVEPGTRLARSPFGCQ